MSVRVSVFLLARLCTLDVVLRISCSPFPPSINPIHPVSCRPFLPRTEPFQRRKPDRLTPTPPPSPFEGGKKKTHPPPWSVAGPLSHAHANAHAHAHACASGSTDVKEPGQAVRIRVRERRAIYEHTTPPTTRRDTTRLAVLGVLVSFRALVSRLTHERALLLRATAVSTSVFTPCRRCILKADLPLHAPLPLLSSPSLRPQPRAELVLSILSPPSLGRPSEAATVALPRAAATPGIAPCSSLRTGQSREHSSHAVAYQVRPLELAPFWPPSIRLLLDRR